MIFVLNHFEALKIPGFNTLQFESEGLEMGFESHRAGVIQTPCCAAPQLRRLHN